MYKMIVKPGLYLVAVLLLTAVRFLQMTVLLGQQRDHTRTLQPPDGLQESLHSRSPPAISLRRESPLALPLAPSPPSPSTTTVVGDSFSAAMCNDKTRLLPALNDPTMQLSPCQSRPWLEANSKSTEKPAVKLVLTNFGWNHPNMTEGLRHPRSLRTRELLQAVVDHPLFDPRGWELYQAGTQSNEDDNIRYLVFLDVETCHESNYPVYGNHAANQDLRGGRAIEPSRWNHKACRSADSCDAVQAALKSPMFRQNPSKAQLVYWDCRGNGSGSDAERTMSRKIAFASLSAHRSQLVPERGDQGLAPPVNAGQFRLSAKQVQNIEKCDESDRPFLMSFVGATRRDSPRSRLLELHNETGGVIARSRAQFREEQQQRDQEGRRQQQQLQQPPEPVEPEPIASPRYYELAYEELLQKSQFAAAPRGTNLFSYRFSEILASGSIPVVHSDGWALPFSDRVVDWTECALVIPEAQVPETVSILRGIRPDQRCRMRQACYRIYRRYFETPEGTVRGVLEGLGVEGGESDRA